MEDEAGALRGALIGAGIGAIGGVLIVILVPILSGASSVGALGVSTFLGALRAIALCAVAGLPLGAIIEDSGAERVDWHAGGADREDQAGGV